MITDIDPYFLSGYAKVNENVEGGTAETFLYKGIEGEVLHRFIRREIQGSSASTGMYDLISPYGFGGPRLAPSTPSGKGELLISFQEAFKEYCLESGVVSEFVRFHPFECNSEDFTDMYHVERKRQTVVTDLEGPQVFEREFSKSVRKKIRKNERVGIETIIRERPSSLEDFKRLYSLTMDRNRATSFYYFNDLYFEKFLAYLKDSILLIEAVYENKIIASALCLFGAGRIHIHLSGTDPDYLHLSPAYSLRNAIAEWGMVNGMSLVHHGGGRTDSQDDSLFMYKRQFGSKVVDFSVGSKIWNRAVYEDLCESRGSSPVPTGFFPAYRA